MGSTQTKTIGAAGEAAAIRHLQQKNYEILDRNYRWARGEIDIVAKQADTLVFVEVKTARGANFGSPETWVDERKQQQLGLVASHYLQEKEIEDTDCRFDVIAIRARGNDWQIRHIENAFWL
ncbi:YraN family protein [bacterium]|nr:YraN family protein [bacterium]